MLTQIKIAVHFLFHIALWSMVFICAFFVASFVPFSMAAINFLIRDLSYSHHINIEDLKQFGLHIENVPTAMDYAVIVTTWISGAFMLIVMQVRSTIRTLNDDKLDRKMTIPKIRSDRTQSKTCPNSADTTHEDSDFADEASQQRNEL